MLTKDFEVSAEGKDALLPTGLKKALFPNGEKLLPQGDASPRAPSAKMVLSRYGRWGDSWYDDPYWRYRGYMGGYGRYGRYGGYGGYMGGYGGYGMG